MSERVTTPYNPRGPHTTGHPPAPEPDPTLTGLATAAGLPGPAATHLAAAITAAGYRAPTPLTHWAHLTDHPPATVITDRHGTPWTVDAVTETQFNTTGPWTLIYTPPVPDITA